MCSLLASPLRSCSAAGLILGLVAGGDLVLPGVSFAGQPNVNPCQKSVLASPAAEARPVAGSSSTGLLLAQALPSQPAGPEVGEPACTYDPILPAPRKIIRGLW